MDKKLNSLLGAENFQELVNLYASIPFVHGRAILHMLHLNRPNNETGLWHCIEDIQRMAFQNNVAPLGIDRLLYLIGSGKYLTQLEGIANDQSYRYRCMTNTLL